MKIVIAIVVVVVAILLLARNRKPKVKVTETKRRASVHKAMLIATSKFHAVSIRFSPKACDAAKAMDGKRLLSTNSPRLPLPDCDAAKCECVFVHHQDRRGRDDRRDSYQNRPGASKVSDDKRHRRTDRRNSDPEDYFS